MTTANIRIGWIGCGTHARAMLLPQLQRLKAQVVAVCDIDNQSLSSTARQFGIEHSYQNYAQLLSHPNLDAVGIAVGPQSHAEIAIAALQRNLPVFLEKPPGANAAQAARIRDAAHAQNLPVVVGFMKRFASGYRIARNQLKLGHFGAPLGYYAQYMTAPTYFTADPDYSGFFLHHCVHSLDLLRYFIGEPSAVRTRKTELASGKLLLHVNVDFSTGALGTLIMGTVQARSTPMEFVQIMGDQQRLEVENITNVRYFRSPSFKASNVHANLSETADTLTWQPNFTVAANEDHKGYHALLEQFINLVVSGTADPDTPTIDDGVATMQILEAMVESFHSAERVLL